MRLWNGWGDDSVTVTLPQSAIELIKDYIGPGEPVKSATLDSVLASVPKSRMPKHPLINTDSENRMRHSHGQSVKDWVALRFNRFGRFTDGVASPSTEEEIHELISFALKKGIILIPSGGRTSVVGHLTPPDSRKPVLTLSLEQMRGLKHLDMKSHLASFYPGTSGVELEASLNPSGLTLGHFPQSYDYSTVGGWVVTRSYGQLSRGYGGIDQLFAGGRLVGGSGILEMPPYPGSAAGPDIRQMVLGSEGRMGVLSEVLVRVKQCPEKEYFHGIIFPDWDHAMEAVRQLGQSSIPFCMLRLSNPEESRVSLALSGEG
ncbi:MAG: FAD-binding oxidoreductase, partial [Spirochaetota bacterium]|nr:FAD-binding oxidoreductase [Spirochaetota bacterium]